MLTFNIVVVSLKLFFNQQLVKVQEQRILKHIAYETVENNFRAFTVEFKL